MNKSTRDHLKENIHVRSISKNLTISGFFVFHRTWSIFSESQVCCSKYGTLDSYWCPFSDTGRLPNIPATFLHFTTTRARNTWCGKMMTRSLQNFSKGEHPHHTFEKKPHRGGNYDRVCFECCSWLIDYGQPHQLLIIYGLLLRIFFYQPSVDKTIAETCLSESYA